MKFLYSGYVIDYEFVINKSPNTILFLHGWGGNKDSFYHMSYLKGYNFLMISFPPFFNTESTVALTLEKYIEIITNILNLHNINEVTIICHSFGFRLTLLLNSKIKITKIICASGAGINFDKPFFKKIFLMHKYLHNLTLKNTESDFCFLNAKRHLRKTNKSNLYPTSSKDYDQLNSIDKATFKNIVNVDLKYIVPTVSCPVLLYWGISDTETQLKIAKWLNKNLLHSKLITVNGDHFAYLNSAEHFLYYSKHFLTRNFNDS